MPTQNDLLARIICAISTAPEWDEAQIADPVINQCEKELYAVIDQLKQVCSQPDLIKLEDVILAHCNAMTKAAMLYGAKAAICMLAAMGAIAPAAFGGEERSITNGIYTSCYDTKDSPAVQG